MTEKIMYRHLVESFPGIVFKNIETSATEIGIPDVYYFTTTQVYAVNGWLELKIGKQRMDGSIVIPYRPGQRTFLIEHIKCNPKTFVLIWYMDRYFLLSTFYLYFHTLNELIENSLYIGTSLKTENFLEILLKKED